MKIDIVQASKRFGKVVALDGVTSSIPSGSRLALVGPNGSGKSTLIRALLGLIDCEGSLLLDGQAPYASRLALAQQLAYVPQVAPAVSATTDELVHVVSITRGLPIADIAASAAVFKLGLSAIAKRPFRQLSGGMKQKLLLAIAFACKPKLLVMDEPTASLDEAARRTFFEMCRALPKETTIVLCSHRLEEISLLAQHVLALADGRVAFDGAASAFRLEERDRAGTADVELVNPDVSQTLARAVPLLTGGQS